MFKKLFPHSAFQLGTKNVTQEKKNMKKTFDEDCGSYIFITPNDDKMKSISTTNLEGSSILISNIDQCTLTM